MERHNTNRIKAVFNWSGGKDSAHALLRAQQSDMYEIVALLTTVNRSTHRSTMHGIPLPLTTGTSRQYRYPSLCRRPDTERKYGRLRRCHIAGRRAFQDTRRYPFHLRRYFPTRCTQIPRATTCSA